MDIITAEDREIVAKVLKDAEALDAAARAHGAAMEALLESVGQAHLRGIEVFGDDVVLSRAFKLPADWKARVMAVKTVSVTVEG